MPVFAIVLRVPNEDVQELIGAKYPARYELNKTFFLVKSESAAKTIAVNVGIGGENCVEGVNGVVFMLNKSYSGFTSSSLWDWLEPDGGEE